MFDAGLLKEAETVYKNKLQNTHPVEISAAYNPLMKYFENKMKSAGVARIYLLVHVKSRAMKFHRKNGFWKMGDVLMEKILK